MTCDARQPWFRHENEFGKARLDVERHKPLTTLILGQTGLVLRETQGEDVTRQVGLNVKEPQQELSRKTSAGNAVGRVAHDRIASSIPHDASAPGGGVILVDA